MEKFKQYLPLIVVAIVGLYALKKFSGGGNAPSIRQVIPLTPTTEPAYTDPLLPFRAQGYAELVKAGIAQTQAETRKEELKLQGLGITTEAEAARGVTDLAQQRASYEFQLGGTSLLNQLQLGLRQLGLAEILGLKTQETELAKTSLQSDLAKYLQQAQLSQQQFLENSYLQQLQLYYQQRQNDNASQQATIRRVTSSQNTGQIVSSIAQAIGSIFGGGSRGGSIFTPPTFPTSGFGAGGGGFG